MKKSSWTDLEQLMMREYGNIAGLIVTKGDETLYENYFNNCNETNKIHVYSVSKSILSILIGIAIDKGYIKSVEQKVLDFFPEYAVKKGEKTLQHITIKHLLTMTAPFKYKFAPFTYIKYFMSSDWLKFSLDLLGGKGKFDVFRYTPLVGPDILSGILIKTTGQTVLEFANENLFTPLSIHVERSIVFKTATEQREFNQSKTMSGWVADPKGINSGGWGLTLSATDMIKIGQLYLHDGVFEGNRIVSSKWIMESTTEHSRWDKINMGYGYLWWLDQDKCFAAMGDSGNVLYINREKKLVIAIASLHKQNSKDRIKLIKNYIEPLVENSNEL